MTMMKIDQRHTHPETSPLYLSDRSLLVSAVPCNLLLLLLLRRSVDAAGSGAAYRRHRRLRIRSSTAASRDHLGVCGR